MDELPGQLPVRLHVVPRGRLEGRQPPQRVLGQDEPVRRAAVVALVALLTVGCSPSGSDNGPVDAASSPDQSSSQSSGESSTPSPTPSPAPVVGQCHRL